MYNHLLFSSRYSGATCGLAFVFVYPSIIYIISLHRENQLTWFALLSHFFIILLGMANLMAQFLIWKSILSQSSFFARGARVPKSYLEQYYKKLYPAISVDCHLSILACSRENLLFKKIMSKLLKNGGCILEHEAPKQMKGTEWIYAQLQVEMEIIWELLSSFYKLKFLFSMWKKFALFDK